MVEAAVAADQEQRVDSARLGVCAAVYDAADARIDEGSRAHGTRLKCHVERKSSESPSAASTSGVAERLDLRMGDGVLIDLAPVSAAPNDFAVLVDDNSPNRHVACRRCCHGFFEREVHEQLVGYPSLLRREL